MIIIWNKLAKICDERLNPWVQTTKEPLIKSGQSSGAIHYVQIVNNEAGHNGRKNRVHDLSGRFPEKGIQNVTFFTLSIIY